MKRLSTALVLFMLLLSAPPALRAQQRGFGVGVIVGEPTGISAKLWTSSINAFDFGLGWSYWGDRMDGRYRDYYNGGQRVHFHMDYLWHSFNAIRSTERFPLYYGIGGRLNSGAGYDNTFAIRGVFGIAWLPRNTPIDVFIELVPSLQLTYWTAFGIDAGAGVRFFF
ncbi:MAG: hypothetical protein ACM3Q4_05985 [Acidobacteriota bacterium]